MIMKFAEKQYVQNLMEMGVTEAEIKKRMFKRVRSALLMLVVFLMGANTVGETYYYALAVIVPIFIYKSDVSKVKREFEKFSLEREIAFGKFMQLIVPYLKKDKGKDTLYMIFSKLNMRVNPALQNALFSLMNEMVAKPNDIQPFINFAKKCSNSDFSLNFMMSLYDFQNSTMEISVIEELSETANNELLKRVNDVIKLKNKKVSKFPMLIAMGVGIIMIPYLFTILGYSISKTGLL